VINCWRSLGTALGTQRTAQTTLVGNIWGKFGKHMG
jgi:hypothetical protein